MNGDVIYSPLKGKAIAITEVKDEMFSQKMLGDVVRQGQVIGEVNWKQIVKEGKDTVVPIVWTNNETSAEIEVITNQGTVDQNTPLYSI